MPAHKKYDAFFDLVPADRAGFGSRVVETMKDGRVDDDDHAVTFTAVSVAMVLGGGIGWAIMSLIHTINASSIGGL